MLKKRNFNTSFIPKRIAGSIPRPITRHVTQHNSTSSQTEPAMSVKEENISFSVSSRWDQDDDVMKRNYAEAVSFINSCHQRVNTEIKNKHPDKTELFLLPMVENFSPLFSYLTGTESVKKTVARTNKRKTKGTFAERKTTEMLPDSISVGDCKKYDENKSSYTRDINIINQQLDNLISIFSMSRNIESSTLNERLEIPPNPSNLPTNEYEYEDTENSSILSDEENMGKVLEPVWSSESEMSTLSELSDIKSDD